MDFRTTYLQELLRVSDFLQMQRNIARSLYANMYAMFGGNMIATVLPYGGALTTDALPTSAGLVMTVPPIMLHQLVAADPLQWSVLGPDGTIDLVQGMNPSAQNFTIIVPPSDSRYYIIEAEIAAITDETAQVLPFYPLIQVITKVGQTHTTTKIWIDSTSGGTTGMTVGDQIIVQGIATADTNPTFIATIGSDGGGPFITLTNALASAPPSGSSRNVRDVTPNQGAPLAGPADSGTALNVDRVRRVTLSLKTGTFAASPTPPPVTAGRIGLYTIGPITSAAVNLTGKIALYSGPQPDGRTGSPFYPSAIGRQHHLGTAGQALKINVNQELSEALVRVAGDVMTGPLFTPIITSDASQSRQYLVDSVATDLTQGLLFLSGRNDPTLGDANFGIKRSVTGFIDLVSILGFRWKAQASAGYDPITFARIITGTYLGNGILGRVITVGFTPTLIIIAHQTSGATDGSAFGFITVDGMRELRQNSADRTMYLIAPVGTFNLLLAGFSTANAIGSWPTFNTNGENYFWVALG